jgi:prepilin-type N-terminal cleavage/methylation domain-containing protein
MPASKDRRRAQSGATLIELLVSLMIVGLALVIVVGTFSTGLLDATLTKRNTTVQAVMQYELEAIGASQFSSSALSYSDCFATESPTSPAAAAGYRGSCPAGPFTLRADVTLTASPTVTTQVWMVTVRTLPDKSIVGSPLSTYKVSR